MARIGSWTRCGRAFGASTAGAFGHGSSVRSSRRSTYCSRESGMKAPVGRVNRSVPAPGGGFKLTADGGPPYRVGRMSTTYIVGAGGIGCAVGYALRAAGVPAAFVDANPRKVEAGRRDG